MACPWAELKPVENPVSLCEVMSEQLARSLHEREVTNLVDTTVEEDSYKELCEADDTDNDAVIAHLLQAQYYNEYNSMLKRTEEKFNRDAKVNISYTNFERHLHGDQDEATVDVNENRDFDRFVSIEKEYASIPRCGYKKVGEGSQIVTKHDMLMTSRRNACKVLQFPPGIHTGDTGGFDVKLNNNVYNSLRAHSHAQCSRDKAKKRPRTK